MMRARGQVQIAHGCSVFSPGIFEDEERYFETVPKVHAVKRDGPIAL